MTPDVFWDANRVGGKKLEIGRIQCCPDEKQSKIVYKFRHKHGKTRTHNSSFLRERMGGLQYTWGERKKALIFPRLSEPSFPSATKHSVEIPEVIDT